jgi:periplasmic protein TonB
MFETINAVTGSGRRGWKETLLASLLIHSLIFGVLIVIPLVYFQNLPSWDVVTVFAGVRAPDPAPPAPPPPAPARHPDATLATNRPIVINMEELIEPSPAKIPLPPDAIEVTGTIWEILQALPEGSDSGIPGGAIGKFHTAGNLLTSSPHARLQPPPPPPLTRREPIKISVLEPSRLIHRVEPVYPDLAIRARVQGAVMLRVVVDESGVVREVEVTSGHALLRQAAMDAVRQWRYKPVILNGEPIPVSAAVTVNFFLTKN